MDYFNTTQEPPEKVKEYSEVNKGQNEKMLEVFVELSKTTHYGLKARNAVTMYRMLHRKEILLTSARRAINSLVRQGKLEIAGKTRGIHGRSVFTYRIKEGK